MARTFGWGGQCAHFVRRAAVPAPALVRMHADGRQPPVIALGKLDGPAARLEVVGHHQHLTDARGDGAGVERRQIVGEDVIPQMGVGVEERGYAASMRGNSAAPPGTRCPAGRPVQPPAPQSPGPAGGRPKRPRMAVDVRGIAGWI